MKPHPENPPLTPEEIGQRTEIEQRILTRTAGRIGDGLDLIKIRNARLYRDHDTFEAYIVARFSVSPGSAYRWISAAEVVQDIILKFSPKGETDTPPAWKTLLRHRNETAIRFLQELDTAEKRWSTYKKAVELAKGHEPKPRHLRQAAVLLQYREDLRDSRNTDRATAFTLIVGVRAKLRETGQRDLARRLDDALQRLRFNESPDRPQQLLPRLRTAKS